MSMPSQITRAINRFGNAVYEDAFKGARNPDDYWDIEAEYNYARELLEKTILRAVKKAGNR